MVLKTIEGNSTALLEVVAAIKGYSGLVSTSIEREQKNHEEATQKFEEIGKIMASELSYLSKIIEESKGVLNELTTQVRALKTDDVQWRTLVDAKLTAILLKLEEALKQAASTSQQIAPAPDKAAKSPLEEKKP